MVTFVALNCIGEIRDFKIPVGVFGQGKGFRHLCKKVK